MTNVHNTVALLMAALAVLAAGAVRAQEARGGGAAANAQVIAELQQISAERTALKAENEQLKQQLAAVTAERSRLEKGVRATDLRVKSSEAALARTNAQEAGTQEKLTQTQAAMQQLIAKFREVVGSLRKSEIEAADAKQTLAMREQDLKVCAEHNQALYKLDDEVLTHFERQGFWSRLASAEPFTRIKRVQLQNYSDESRARAADQRYSPPAGALPQN